MGSVGTSNFKQYTEYTKVMKANANREYNPKKKGETRATGLEIKYLSPRFQI